MLIQRMVGEDTDVEFEWEQFEHTNLVVARWLFQREVMFEGPHDEVEAERLRD